MTAKGKPPLEEWDMSSEDNRGFHEAADIFPAMSDDEFELFKKDIAENGLQTPIVTLPDGRIIDGRHRWRACMETRTKPRYQVHSGNPWAYVISANLHRRHLSSSQRAMVAARIAVRPAGGARPGAGRQIPETAFEGLPPTQGQTTELLGIGHTSITKARRVVNTGIPELASLVDDGRVKVETAARIAAMNEDTQREFVKRVQDGEKPTSITPAGRNHSQGRNKTVIKQTSVTVFTKINADSLSSGLFGIEMSFKDVATIDKAVTPDLAKRLISQLRSTKAVLNRIGRLLHEIAEDEE